VEALYQPLCQLVVAALSLLMIQSLTCCSLSPALLHNAASASQVVVAACFSLRCALTVLCCAQAIHSHANSVDDGMMCCVLALGIVSRVEEVALCPTLLVEVV
jgi:hypothetical protein